MQVKLKWNAVGLVKKTKILKEYIEKEIKEKEKQPAHQKGNIHLKISIGKMIKCGQIYMIN